MEEILLIRQMKEDDPVAFNRLYEQYKNMAFHTAYLITRNIADSEDIVQETFVTVYLHRKELKKESGFKSWMMQILVHTAYRMCKKKAKEFPDELISEKADFHTEPSSLDHILKQEQTTELAKAVHALPIKQRTAVILFYYQDCSIREIAHICGCLEGTVKSRLHIARTNLKKRLLEETAQSKGGIYET